MSLYQYPSCELLASWFQRIFWSWVYGNKIDFDGGDFDDDDGGGGDNDGSDGGGEDIDDGDAGFIQASVSKIQGLFKDFKKQL